MLVADCETNGFLHEMDRLWCLQLGTLDGDEVDLYCDVLPGYRPISEGIARLKEAPKVIFHNGLDFDMWAINKIYPDTVRWEQIVDTLVISRLLDPEKEGGHSLKAWGERLKLLKGESPEAWDTWDEEKMAYARQDIPVTRALAKRLLVPEKLAPWGQAIDLEHQVAYLMALQMQNGVRLDLEHARRLETKLRTESAVLEHRLQDVFPPRWVVDRTRLDKDPKTNQRLATKTAKANRADLGLTKGWTFTPVVLELFNPSSRDQAASRLQALGWKPKAFTKGGAVKIDEETLSGLPWPEAQELQRYFTILKRLGQLADGDNAWLKQVREDGRVYGRVNPNGARTGRMTHFKPNTANVDKDPEMRACWTASDGWLLVGCDAEGLEARMMAHYLEPYDGGAFRERLLNGSKELGTDVHSVNQVAVRGLNLGDPGRDGGKTILYALIYGARDPKLGWTFKDALRNRNLPIPRKSDKVIGGLIRQVLMLAITGLDKLLERLEKVWKSKKYIRAIDGRKLRTRKSHTLLNTLFQGSGAVVMKVALVVFHFEMTVTAGLQHSTDFRYCLNVHDEVQIEARPEVAEQIGALFAEAIAEAGRRLGIRCPLAGSYSVGKNWAETH
jgi:DNA polymerase-1